MTYFRSGQGNGSFTLKVEIILKRKPFSADSVLDLDLGLGKKKEEVNLSSILGELGIDKAPVIYCDGATYLCANRPPVAACLILYFSTRGIWISEVGDERNRFSLSLL